MYINQSPKVLISDFGQGNNLHEDSLMRGGGTGTLEYMAPEVVERGKVRNCSEQSDLWSLGMVLYFMCCHSLPFSDVDNVDRLLDEIISFESYNIFIKGFRFLNLFLKSCKLLCKDSVKSIQVKDGLH